MVVVVLALLARAGVASGAPADPLLVWPRSSETATDGVDAAVREAGAVPREFGPLRARLISESEAQAVRTRAAIDATERGLIAAREAFLAQDYDAMIAALMTAEAAAVATLSSGPLCSATLWELEFQLGLAYTVRARDGDRERAHDRFGLALALDSERRPIPGLYGPDIGLGFLQAADDAVRRPERPVIVRVTPADAEVTIDCRTLNTTTEALRRPGLHVVRVDAPGHRPEARVAALADPLELKATLQPTSGAPLGEWWRRGALDPTSASARAAVHAYTGVTRIVWLESSEARHVARLVTEGVVRRVARADTAAEAVVQVLAIETPPPPTTPRRRSRTGLWVGLATVALGSVALGLGLGLRDTSGPRLHLVVQ